MHLKGRMTKSKGERVKENLLFTGSLQKCLPKAWDDQTKFWSLELQVPRVAHIGISRMQLVLTSVQRRIRSMEYQGPSPGTSIHNSDDPRSGLIHCHIIWVTIDNSAKKF